MSKLLKSSFSRGYALATAVLSLVPDSIVGSVKFCYQLTEGQNLLINRIVLLVVALCVSLLANGLYYKFRRRVKFRGIGYCVQVEYGDLYKCEGCQRVIAFDECFTTVVGSLPHEIKRASICGQYLEAHPDLDMQDLIRQAGVKPEKERSSFNDQVRYESGSIVPNGDDLLLAFARLDKNGRGYFPSREDYLASLAVMWKEVGKQYQGKDVCVPVLGGGQTTIGDVTPTQQELIDLIIGSYKLQIHKIKLPQKLRIICREEDGISLNKVGDAI